MPRLVSADPPGLAIAVSLDEALAAGLTTAQVRYRVSISRWEPLGRARYLRIEALDAIDDQWERRNVRHAAMAASAASSVPGSAVGITSAALVLGAPLLGPPSRIELMAPAGGWTGMRGGVRLHGLALDPDEFMPLPQREGPPLVGDPGVRVTSPERTWVDLARTLALPQALAAGDAMLRSGLTSVEELEAAAQRASGMRGCRGVARALPHLSPLRESPFESASFAGFVEWGIPLPEMQVTLHDEEGFVGRVDFLWAGARVIGEADGAEKFRNRGVLLAERRRQQRLEALGYIVVRWTWDELMNEPWKVQMRILRALRLAA